MNQFIDYMVAFYGEHGVYNYGFTREQIRLATLAYKHSLHLAYPGDVFQGDSIDRERVRDIVTHLFYTEQEEIEWSNLEHTAHTAATYTILSTVEKCLKNSTKPPENSNC